MVIQRISTRKSGATAPCYGSFSSDGRYAFVANYYPAVIRSFAVSAAGQLGEEAISTLTFHDASHVDPARQDTAHGHCILQHPTNPKLLYVVDLGADALRLLQVSKDGELQVAETLRTEPGSGPRQIAFHPTGNFLYCLYELSHSVSVWRMDGNGHLRHMQTVDIAARQVAPDPNQPYVSLSGAAIKVSRDGRYIYASLRNDHTHPDGDCLAVLAVSEHDSEHLKVKQHAYAPAAKWHIRDLCLSGDKDQRYLLCGGMVNGGEVLLFERDSHSGKLRFVNRLELKDGAGQILSPSSFMFL